LFDYAIAAFAFALDGHGVVNVSFAISLMMRLPPLIRFR